MRGGENRRRRRGDKERRGEGRRGDGRREKWEEKEKYDFKGWI